MNRCVVRAQTLIYTVHLTGFSLLKTRFVVSGTYALSYIGTEDGF